MSLCWRRSALHNELSGHKDESIGDSIEAGELSFAGRHGVDACRVDVGMPEEVCQANDVFFVLVVIDRKQMAEVVREDFAAENVRSAGKGLHHVEDIGPVHRIAVSRDEDAAGLDTLLMAPLAEYFAQRGGQEYFPGLSFEGDDGATCVERFYCNVREFANADACRGNGLHDMEELFFPFFSGGF